jgi:hypothetical protein
VAGPFPDFGHPDFTFFQEINFTPLTFYNSCLLFGHQLIAAQLKHLKINHVMA